LNNQRVGLKFPFLGPIVILFLIAFAKIIAGVFWQEAIVIINILLGAFLSVILADLVFIFTKNKIAACFIGFFYALNPEIMLWARFVLSDISYMFINFFLFYLVVRFFLSKDIKAFGYNVIIILTLFLNCFYRPTGIVMVPIIFLAFYLKMIKKEIRWKTFFSYFAVLVLVLIPFHAVIIKNVACWPFEFGKSYLKDWVAVSYREGMVIHNRLNTYHQAPVTLGDYISITLDKFVHFFYFSDKMFKFYHKIINYIFFPPLYVLFILGVIETFKKEIFPKFRSLIVLAIMVVIGFSLFHAMASIDHDWRFRLPIFPYLLFVAGIGLDFLLRLFLRQNSQCRHSQLSR